ncbi:hypothetical protein EXIGLDRAFT_744705 [Exidia glandulosa HHB12029]|uniref:DUF6533 domain-containing protein n=1 Tax=Exidia glandulosa HHB12029 TaxID=1314781 RepID=A0A166BLL2_EXIGL|nr:hypothetical protein EXIGLDRAFT_744705 [Exidia glandulosa HHB12029]
MPSLNFARADAPPAADPSAGAPNIAQIVLPPGFTLDMFFDLQSKAIHIGICVAVAFAIICWDYVVLLMDEVRLYRTGSKQLWQTPATWAFIVLRYAAFVATLPALFFTTIQTQHCQAAVVASQAGALLVVASSGIIFCNRVVAIWSNNRIIIGVLAVAWTGMMGCWIAVAVHYNAITGPPNPLISNCQMQPIVSWAPISFASSVAFDVIVLVLSIYKLRSNSSGFGQSAIARQISNDNIAYFLLTAATNITVLSIQALGDDFALIKPTAVPFSTVVTVAMAQRVYLNLKLFHSRTERIAAGLPPTQPSGSHGTTSSTSRRGKSTDLGYKSFAPAWEMERKHNDTRDTAVEMPVVYIRREINSEHACEDGAESTESGQLTIFQVQQDGVSTIVPGVQLTVPASTRQLFVDPETWTLPPVLDDGPPFNLNREATHKFAHRAPYSFELRGTWRETRVVLSHDQPSKRDPRTANQREGQHKAQYLKKLRLRRNAKHPYLFDLRHSNHARRSRRREAH